MWSAKRTVAVYCVRSLGIFAALALGPLLGGCSSGTSNTSSDAGADSDAPAHDGASDAPTEDAAAVGLGFTPSNVDPRIHGGLRHRYHQLELLHQLADERLLGLL